MINRVDRVGVKNEKIAEREGRGLVELAKSRYGGVPVPNAITDSHEICPYDFTEYEDLLMPTR